MDRQALAQWLYENLPGKRVERIGDQVPGWEPVLGRCHDNVARWLELNPTHTAVRGWLDTSFEVPENRRRFSSHSIVADADGKLLDVTLRDCDPQCSFIRHPWSEAEFMATVPNNGLPTIDYWISPDSLQLPEPTPQEEMGRQF